MDIDQFLARNTPTWKRLQQLTQRAGMGVRRLSGAELQELISLYQRTASHLSYAQTNFRDPVLTARLSQQLAASGSIIYGSRPRSIRSFGQFFTRTFPAALWRIRGFVAVSAVLTLGPAIAVGGWLANSPRAVEATAPAAVRQAYVNEDFASYYSSQPAAAFATEVYTNNIRVAALAFAGGILICIPTAYLLVSNGAGVGQAAGLFAAAGQSSKFYGLILPHGLLELTSVIIAGAAGLRLGWAVIDPGDRTRATAIAEEGRRSVVLVLGVILTLLIAGLIEGFVTGSSLPTAVRVGIGVAVEVAFLVYAVGLGRSAAAQGFTGALNEGGR
ncbi:MAG: hypothetical protein QOF81_1498 [Acidimicrobiaceae bacterium]|jgi:uncharacterized membrane protein SpoIIM required for sporulation|nr:hypothetical protein [Acidimicrobiaceae bacterium]